MTQQRLISRQYRLGPGTGPVGDPNPSFHRIDACSPGCSDQGAPVNPAACSSNGMVPGNIWCAPAHIGQVNVTSPYSDNVNLTQINRVAKFVDNMYYGWLGDHIWEFDAQTENALLAGSTPSGGASGDPGGLSDWTVAASPSTYIGGDGAIGLYPMNIDGTPYLVTAVQNSSTTWRSVKLNGDTGIWTSGVMSSSVSTSSPTNGGLHAEVCHKNVVYFIDTGSRTIKVYNPRFDTITEINLPSTLRWPMDLCVYEDNIYLLCKEDIGGGRADIVIYQILGSFVTKVLTLESNALTSTDNYEGRNTLFVDNVYSDPAKLYAINFMEGSPDGAGLFQMEMQGGVLTLNGRLPSNPNMPRGVNFGGGDEDDIWRVFTDSKRASTSGGIPLWEFRAGGNNGDEYQAYLFQGSGTSQPFWVNITNHFIFSYAHERGVNIGARVGNVGEVNLDITSFDTSDSKIENGLIGINFEIIPSFTNYPAGTPLAVRFLIDNKGHSHKKIATLSSPSSGTLTGDNRILLTAVSGVTFSVDWNFTSDNYSGAVNLIGHVSTTGVS